ncbi:K(+)-transporting ATPase subunit C [Chitinophaga horti]|uniref:Potassium-transporting ATPase KdpC subunit n=1 Tax=Chitinophaga horti TaxID=2920382 RepID=A0ABY6IZ65_9BACT|nr:K(+)-transporting ATPase subunit C [Chitinophaga horti]UYQ92682.1 K(+)-transporting ATPase subunit C [Chitinophaga horti]
MKKYLMPAVRLTAVLIVLLAVMYPLLIAAVGKMSKGGGNGETVAVNGKVVGFANVGQSFTEDKYFYSRPSAVNYNAAGSGGSNKGASNADYLKVVAERIDTFLAHNPGVKRDDVPVELVTASASGLDPHLSPAAVYVQVARIATIRGIPQERINKLVESHVQAPLLGLLGPSTVNILQLNIALDALSSISK